MLPLKAQVTLLYSTVRAQGQAFSNLYFLLAKSEEPLEGEPGFLAEEGPEAEAEVERTALYLLLPTSPLCPPDPRAGAGSPASTTR